MVSLGWLGTKGPTKGLKDQRRKKDQGKQPRHQATNGPADQGQGPRDQWRKGPGDDKVPGDQQNQRTGTNVA